MTVAVLFPGQGIQRRGMGAELFDHYPDLVKVADDVLGYSVKDLCVEDPDSRLDHTEFSQPAIYVVNALAYRELLREDRAQADVLAGHSLGEYNALEAAGAVDFATGLRIVRERARLMNAVTGSMTAVMGLPVETIEAVFEQRPDLDAEVAAINAPQQVVVSSLDTGPSGLVEALRVAGALKTTALRVSGPFHSRYMADAAAKFAEFLGRHRHLLRQPATSVIANRDARPHEVDDMVTDLAEQIDHTLLWWRSMETLLDRDPATSFVEVNGSVLTSFTRQIQRHLRRPAHTAGSGWGTST
jgi:malonyl CoA-acyl carrier protein transacylase